jgi:hypothetical protein
VNNPHSLVELAGPEPLVRHAVKKRLERPEQDCKRLMISAMLPAKG